MGTAEGCGQRRDTLGCVCSRAPSGGRGGENRLQNRAGARDRGRREMEVRGVRSGGIPDMFKVRADRVS